MHRAPAAVFAPSALALLFAAIPGCKNPDMGERDGASDPEAGAGARTGDADGASTGGRPVAPGGAGGGGGGAAPDDAGGDGAATCTQPAIGAAMWPACAVSDGGAASTTPDGVVLADWSNGPWAGMTLVLGSSIYVVEEKRADCFPLRACSSLPWWPYTWSVASVEGCPPRIVPIGSGDSRRYLLQDSVGSPYRSYGSLFAPVPDGLFWVNYAGATASWGQSDILRGRTGEPAYVSARPSSDSLRRLFSHLSYHSGRLYWVEEVFACESPLVVLGDCDFLHRRLVSADSALSELPDESLTTLLDGEGRDAASDLFNLQEAFTLSADETHVYVLAATGLHRVPVLGGTWETLTSCLGGAAKVVLAGDHAYAAVPRAGHPADAGPPPLALTRVPKAGGACEVVATDMSGALAAHQGSVYFGRESGGSCTSIFGLRPGGTEPELIASTQAGVSLRSVESGRLVADVPAALVGLALPW